MLNYFRLFLLSLAISIIYLVFFVGDEDEKAYDIKRQRKAFATIGKREVSTVGYVIEPTKDKMYFANTPLKIQWKPEPAAEISFINIDLCTVASAQNLFVVQIANTLPATASNYIWMIPRLLNSSASYSIRVWGPKGTYFWQIPDSPPFAISRYPLGVTAPVDPISAGSTLRIRYFASPNILRSSSGLSLAIMDLKSSYSILQQGFIFAEGLDMASSYFDWMVPSTLPASTTYQFTIAGQTKDGIVISDYSSEFTIRERPLDTSLILTVSKSTVTIGDNVTVNYSINSETLSTWSLYWYSSDIAHWLFYAPVKIVSNMDKSDVAILFNIPDFSDAGLHWIYLYGTNSIDGALAFVGRISISVTTTVENTGLTFSSPINSNVWTTGMPLTVAWNVDTTIAPAIAYFNIDIYSDQNGIVVHRSILAMSLSATDRSFSRLVPVQLLSGNDYYVQVIGIYKPGQSLRKATALAGRSESFKIISNAIPAIKYDGTEKQLVPDPNESIRIPIRPNIALLVAIAFLYIFCS